MNKRSPISQLADAGLGFDGSPLPGRSKNLSDDQAIANRYARRLRWLAAAGLVYCIAALYVMVKFA